MCGSGLIGGGGGRIELTWLLTRLKDRLSVSSSEKRSLRFMSNRGIGLRCRCWVYKFAFLDVYPCISTSDLVSISDDDLYVVVGDCDAGCAWECRDCGIARKACCPNPVVDMHI